MNIGTNGHPRALRNEADWLPATIEDLAELHEQLIGAGHTPAVASGICSWVALKAAGRPDQTGAPTRARYRKILAELAAGMPDGPGRGRRHLEPVRPAAHGDSVDRPESTLLPGSVKHVARWRSPFRRAA